MSPISVEYKEIVIYGRNVCFWPIKNPKGVEKKKKKKTKQNFFFQSQTNFIPNTYFFIQITKQPAIYDSSCIIITSMLSIDVQKKQGILSLGLPGKNRGKKIKADIK